jgi:hypothetical protein
MRMIPNPTPTTLTMLILGVSTFVFIMFLPALLELKRPRDAGPRMITGHADFILPEIRNMAILSVKKEQGFDQTLARKIADVIAVLPNLEM